MLSGEGNKNGEKTIGLISKKATLHVQHTFFVHFFAVVLHDYNVKLPETSLKEMSHTFLFTFFFYCRSCSPGFHWWPLAFLMLSPPLLQNFHVVFPTKKSPLFFYLSLQISVALFIVELRWPAAYFLFFSVFLLLCIPNLWT